MTSREVPHFSQLDSVIFIENKKFSREKSKLRHLSDFKGDQNLPDYMCMSMKQTFLFIIGRPHTDSQRKDEALHFVASFVGVVCSLCTNYR